MVKNTVLMSYLLLGALLISCSSQPEKQKEKSPPNIIFILTDDQGWTHTSHRADPELAESASDYYETPHMDRLASSGVLFTNGYAPNPICSPTRHSILLGQNAARHIYNKNVDWYKNASDRLTIPKAIKRVNQNYQTAHFGKWHVAIEPGEAGYDYHDGMTSNSDGNVFGTESLGAREYSEATEKYLIDNKEQNPAGVTLAGKPSAYWNEENPKDIFGITDRAKEFMQRNIAANKPFYVQLSHYATHLALSAKEGTYDYFKEKEQGKRHTNAEFAAMLKDLDTSVGEVMDFVVEQGIADNTYIFLMSDNGGRLSLNQIAIIDENKQLAAAKYSKQDERNIPLRDGKHSFYEGGIRVPFLVMGPGIASNRLSNVPVTGLDLLPTFASLAGGDFTLSPDLDGGSMLPVLMDETNSKINRNEEALFFHQGAHRKPRSAIIKGDFKLVKYWIAETKYENTPKVELFNLANDPFEAQDIASKSPDQASELEQELVNFLTEVNAETERLDIDDPFDRLVTEMTNEK